jgi:hypothetical protein
MIWGGVPLVLAALAALLATLAGVFAGALAAGLTEALAVALAVGLVGCTTSFSPRPSSATGSTGPSLRRHWRGRSDLLLE